uniref:Transposase n=1 Tax=Heterorhabditis bacteriophora TaxID=37862 RepID=A0A1I7X219_HETBA
MPGTALLKRDWVKDHVYLVQFPRAGCIPSPSPFALKLETWLRMADIPYTLFIAAGLYDVWPSSTVPLPSHILSCHQSTYGRKYTKLGILMVLIVDSEDYSCQQMRHALFS